MFIRSLIFTQISKAIRLPFLDRKLPTKNKFIIKFCISKGRLLSQLPEASVLCSTNEKKSTKIELISMKSIEISSFSVSHCIEL